MVGIKRSAKGKSISVPFWNGRFYSSYGTMAFAFTIALLILAARALLSFYCRRVALDFERERPLSGG